jgi:hypothetical protein
MGQTLSEPITDKVRAFFDALPLARLYLIDFTILLYDSSRLLSHYFRPSWLQNLDCHLGAGQIRQISSRGPELMRDQRRSLDAPFYIILIV